jgi:TetR/AcrR family transcriptional regulator, cholesterol catabolism regulator
MSNPPFTIGQNSSSPSIDLRSRIVSAARELFLEHGYSKVSTNEIADALGISKKTLYREFETKEEILRACVVPRLKETSKLIDGILADRVMPFPEKLKAIMSTIGFQQQRVTPVLLRDVSVHAPELWHEIQEHKQVRFRKFGELLEEGIKRGVFRSDIPKEIILRTYTSAAENLLTPQSLGELPCTAHEVFQNLVTILFEGILEPDARKKIKIARSPRKSDRSPDTRRRTQKR